MPPLYSMTSTFYMETDILSFPEHSFTSPLKNVTECVLLTIITVNYRLRLTAFDCRREGYSALLPKKHTNTELINVLNKTTTCKKNIYIY